MDQSRRGTLFVAAAAVLYSIGGLCIKVIPWNGMSINGGRTAIALLVIGGYMAASRHPLKFNRWVLLGALGWYQPLIDFAGAGAAVPLTGFGSLLARGVREAVAEQGLLGALAGGLQKGAPSIAAAILFSVLAALLFHSRDQC